MRLELDFGTLQRIEDLPPAVRRNVRRHATEYLSLLEIARRHAGKANPSSAEAQSRAPKLAGIKALQAEGFGPRSAVAAFRHICAELETEEDGS